ncbi:MAG: cardiolipin synthase [Bacilli bacterium]|nr:cardiolipin synthase [Bacilli bacterium]
MKKNKGENVFINNLIKLIILVLGLILQILVIIFLYGATNSLATYATYIFEIIKFTSIIYIIYKPINASYKIIWIILLMFMPILGFVAYMLWGNNRTPKKLRKKLNKIRRDTCKLLPIDKDIYNNLYNKERLKEAKYLLNVTDYPMYRCLDATYFNVGEDYYKNLLTDLKKAEKYILMEFFIISESNMWNEIYEVLKEKAKKGIKVYLIYDSLGSLIKKPKDLEQQLEEANIKYLKFNPMTPFIRSYINYRDHRKIIVIDGNCCYTGGINIGDEYINVNSRLGHWKDSGIRVTGKCVNSFIIMFFKLWNLNCNKLIKYSDFLIENNETNKGYIIPYSDNPMNRYNPSENTYINIINNAEDYVYIMTPYLIIDSETESSLISASLSGIDVRIIVPSIPDKKIVNACTKSFYDNLIKSGIRIYEYTPGFIHSKVILSDDAVCNVGTVNFDFRSFYLNYECGAWMYNTGIESDIKKDFNSTFKCSKEITIKDIKRKKIGVRILEALLRLISPLL